MSPITAILIDDEKSGRENLSGLLHTHCPQIDLAGEATSVASAIPLIEQTNPQLIFLDIEMPGANGFQLLEHFQNFTFEVIFVTAYDNYAIKAIRFSAADYILKPININELKQAVHKVSERIHQKRSAEQINQLRYNSQHPQNPRIGLPTADRIEFIEVKSIIRCQGESNYTHLFFENRKPLLVAKTLVEFEELLKEHHFIRAHKTHLVNLNHVQSYLKNDGGRLLMSNGDIVQISRRRKETVTQELMRRF
ncbi:LytR/AlgR family response regulator transcription factor [Sunxiuqinia elliptica]|uniref:LytTR family two component transcriptional regulator n=1 Tax=Sunxiuqinia elliptica TaxID=655355 RepID=A0A4R6H7K1_9BACT|nr:LytTR family DNA-binding domain-containing protein [Sunxiuqinia elliptica]TDO03994.1 LytTR family two component transcriptional regulator [Sunxiuqinia elliptica]TDO62276.1 LytTR family two component transcriptional regulator [Sunxiuqinia elliptica]